MTYIFPYVDRKGKTAYDQQSPDVQQLDTGNTGCGVFKGGMQNLKDFWLKINCSEMKLLNFENWE